MKTAYHNMEMAGHAFGSLPEMDDVQFRQWVELLEKRTGTVIPPERKSFLVTNLGIRMREIGCASYQEYYEKLNSGVNGLMEWSTLVDRITVHETRFFRHPSSLEVIRQYVLSKPVDPKRNCVSLQAWSVACSTGEEAYTLGMVIDQALLQLRDRETYFGITATDISPASLATGRRAIYSAQRVESISPALISQYFERRQDGTYQVSDLLRKRVCFARMNALEADQVSFGKMDIIYCQNLLIYFNRDTREKIVNNLVRHLLPGGMLILGSGELLGWENPLVEKINDKNTLAYRRVAEGG